ncbi:hypothetical protein BTE48_14490 [Oceanospirillum multiglobuliferum]|uniref:Phosphoribosyltransferase domain-containing protein n=2 Tax=Oceanospirillum multiglobuliferum TaxID=64969 RepID=A0A1V4T1I9_9GAMM|nr:hypothetical protein BTE48_14490 [Oceanospirillum multiglobuliferum]
MGGRCLACLAIAQDNIALCSGCEQSLALNREPCVQCAEPFTAKPNFEHQAICASCQADQPAFSRTYAPYLYAYPLDRLISRFKDDGQMIYGQLLSQLLAERLRDNFSELEFQRPDQVMAVPIHITRRFSRGFNPAALLADALSHQLSCHFNPKLCVKTKVTEKQQVLNREQRQQNLHDSFQLTQSVEGQRIAVVDDVMTTGATARVIAQLLRDNGAAEVYIWALARTPLTP